MIKKNSKSNSDLLNEYDTNFDVFNEIKNKLELLINDLLSKNNIRSHQVNARVKERESFKNKINKKFYADINDITDCIGIRIITYFEDEVETVANLIKREFIIDSENSIDKRHIENDRFGYKSLHYIISISKRREALPEYSNFVGRKAEVQIRSILQHSWAEIEHDLGYKSEIGIPSSLRRNFSRLSALLEIADIEFVRLRDNLKNYKIELERIILSEPEKVELNKTTLQKFIDFDLEYRNLLVDIALKLTKDLKDNHTEFYMEEIFVNDNYGALEELLIVLNKYKIRNIKLLNDLIRNNKDLIIKYSIISNKREMFIFDSLLHSVSKSQPLVVLITILLIINEDKSDYESLIYEIGQLEFEDHERIYSELKDKFKLSLSLPEELNS